nr:helix-turn-helix domain-containing protein [uncultured Prevotella sp.]
MDKLDITRAIKSRGFMVKEVAEKLGISIVAMSQRANKDNPTVKSLREVANVIGCDIKDLFYRVDENGNLIEENQQSLSGASNGKAQGNALPLSKETASQASDIFSPLSPADIDEHIIKTPASQDVMPVTTFCPHCGKKVRVGVVLLPEE